MEAKAKAITKIKQIMLKMMYKPNQEQKNILAKQLKARVKK